ncbi:unnamed protein product [Didymodactylos carnosus]|uniref:Uncharacterized protein n=1 Tax=Didymodactylos carnosus TaxID=1234261 RepID=A0A8S2DJH4_9BILA|nr:unnamed protein product [Didymodactylos carnosus]CAF3746840.1 unnamed protein product [Didymodactylos carnosus]
MFDDIDLDLFMFWQKPITYSILLWTTDEYPDTENHVYSPHKKIPSNATVVVNVQSKAKLKRNHRLHKRLFREAALNSAVKFAGADNDEKHNNNDLIQLNDLPNDDDEKNSKIKKMK